MEQNYCSYLLIFKKRGDQTLTEGQSFMVQALGWSLRMNLTIYHH
jgi:hypothetical protein